MQKSGAIKPKH